MGNATTSEPRAFPADTAMLAGLAFGVAVLHFLSNGQYGFHRDELATLDDARHLAWGYVAYPPVTPFLGHVSLELFGTSLRGARFFPVLAQSACIVLSGLMAREFGGKRFAQLTAALAVAIAPVSLASAALLQYVAFDYFWWVLVAYLVIRLLRSDDPRWFLGIGVAVGLGMMTKYSMLFLVVGLGAGLLATDAKKYFKSRWLWMGAALSLLIFLPNLIWQMQHHFISLDFLRSIHARDVRIGRTAGFLPDQLKEAANFVTIPLWAAGLVSLFAARGFKQFRAVAWMYVVPLAIFIAAKGRGYYLAPAYPMLLAAGAVMEERWLATVKAPWGAAVRAGTFAAIALGGVLVAAVVLPIAPINSGWWNRAGNDDFREEIGWPELVAEVARIHDALPAAEKGSAGILTGNYGEAGAINLYGPGFGLPTAISGVNSYWQRGYGDPPPRTLIVLGLSAGDVHRIFQTCELSGHVTNRYGVGNEETLEHPDIFTCRDLRMPWPNFWDKFRHFG